MLFLFDITIQKSCWTKSFFKKKDAKHFRPLIMAMKFELSNGIFLNRFLKTFLLKGSTSKTDKHPKTFKVIKLDSLFSYFLGG